jgi:hypothetical protein
MTAIHPTDYVDPSWSKEPIVHMPKEHTGQTFVNKREEVLLTANCLVNGDRNAQYGEPNQDFQRTADLWNVLLNARLEYLIRNAKEWSNAITPSMVAEFQILLKLSRNTHQKKLDNWIDIAGYAACGADCES